MDWFTPYSNISVRDFQTFAFIDPSLTLPEFGEGTKSGGF